MRRGSVVGEGYHRRAGELHAEALALHRAGPRARAATLYVTLEPCCHLAKRTPPCVPSIIAGGITRVVVAARDPNPKVRGQGLAALRRARLRVDIGVGSAGAEKLIEPYRTLITSGRPFVTLKAASTLDGKIATAKGESRWITGPAARKLVHFLRARSDAIVTGIGTILADDPSLTARVGAVRGRTPLRIVLDPSLRIPLRAKVLKGRKAPALIVTTAQSPPVKRAALRKIGAEVLVLPSRRGRIQWRALLSALGKRGIASLLIEGCAEVNASALREGVVDRVLFFLAPRLLGGRDAVGAIGGLSPARLRDALLLKRAVVMRVGPDILVEGYRK